MMAPTGEALAHRHFEAFDATSTVAEQQEKLACRH